MFFQICEFLFAFMLPFQDLPRLKIFNFELRPSMLLVPFLGIYFLKCLLKNKLLHKKIEPKILISLGLLTTYLTVHVLLIHFDPRAAGFLLWFFINVFVLIYALMIRSEWIAKGYFASICVGMLHILLQRINPFILVDYEKIMSLIDFQGKVRLFSLFGEPSFACLNILFLLCFCVLKRGRIYQLLSCVCILCIGLTYSRLGNIGVSIILASMLFSDYRAKRLWKYSVSLISFTFIAYLIVYVFFPNIYTPNRWLEIHGKPEVSIEVANRTQETITNKEKQFNQRFTAIIRGMEVIKSHPLVGIGFGNSRAYIFENKIHPELRNYYEGLHNLYEEIWAEIGLIGLLLYLFFIYSTLPITYTPGSLSPYLFTLCYSMQLCQNINMPVLWLGLIAMIYFSKSSVTVEA